MGCWYFVVVILLLSFSLSSSGHCVVHGNVNVLLSCCCLLSSWSRNMFLCFSRVAFTKQGDKVIPSCAVLCCSVIGLQIKLRPVFDPSLSSQCSICGMCPCKGLSFLVGYCEIRTRATHLGPRKAQNVKHYLQQNTQDQQVRKKSLKRSSSCLKLNRLCLKNSRLQTCDFTQNTNGAGSLLAKKLHLKSSTKTLCLFQ